MGCCSTKPSVLQTNARKQKQSAQNQAQNQQEQHEKMKEQEMQSDKNTCSSIERYSKQLSLNQKEKIDTKQIYQDSGLNQSNKSEIRKISQVEQEQLKDTIQVQKKDTEKQQSDKQDSLLTVSHQNEKQIIFPQIKNQQEQSQQIVTKFENQSTQKEEKQSWANLIVKERQVETILSSQQVEIEIQSEKFQAKSQQSNLENKQQQIQEVESQQEIQDVDTIVNDAIKNQEAQDNNEILTNDFAQQFYCLNNLHNEPPNWKLFKIFLINHLELNEGL